MVERGLPCLFLKIDKEWPDFGKKMSWLSSSMGLISHIKHCFESIYEKTLHVLEMKCLSKRHYPKKLALSWKSPGYASLIRPCIGVFTSQSEIPTFQWAFIRTCSLLTQVFLFLRFYLDKKCFSSYPETSQSHKLM